MPKVVQGSIFFLLSDRILRRYSSTLGPMDRYSTSKPSSRHSTSVDWSNSSLSAVMYSFGFERGKFLDKKF